VQKLTPHVCLTSVQADQFAIQLAEKDKHSAIQIVKNEELITEARRKVWEQEQAELKQQESSQTAVAAVPTLDHSSMDKYLAEQQKLQQATSSPSPSSVIDAAAKPIEGGLGTVGAVALDMHGHVCAATSTGGLSSKLPGRVGDTPIIGAGTYAALGPKYSLKSKQDNKHPNTRALALSCTGHGELFMKAALAKEISTRFHFTTDAATTTNNDDETSYSSTLSQIASSSLNADYRVLDGGLIAIDDRGDVALPFNSCGMYRGGVGSHGRELFTHVWPEAKIPQSWDKKW
jgi:isoaspartyl peptidase/L-asparaginase-like protein (Ntn-hydrolase superfamily)